MSITVKVIKGSGGDSGDQHTPVEAPNTLSSTAQVQILDLISAGEIRSLTTGDARSVYFNDTQLGNEDESLNFNNVSWHFRKGTPFQDKIPGFSSAESEVSVNTQLSYGIAVIRTVSTEDVDAARITIKLPQGMFSVNDDGDTNGHTVSVTVSVKPTSGGTWMQAQNIVITGKTMTPYEHSIRIEKPAGMTSGTWDVRLVRASGDDPNNKKQSTTYWDRFTEIQDVSLNYPYDALIATSFDAKSIGSSIPTRKYLVDGILCQIPNNYDPDTRTYTGAWTGTFVTDWTDNPAWICYYLLTNTQNGLGNYIDTSEVDFFSFYEAAQFNDAQVDDGNGGTEPRFTFNGVLNTRSAPWTLIQQVASTFNSVIVPFGGAIRCIQDRPMDVDRLITEADVIDGLFDRSATGLSQRHTACQVTYNDANNRYKTTIIEYQDDDGVARYGYNLNSISLFGCTSHGQAMRTAKWVVDTEMHQLETISFKVGFNHADIVPGTVINIMDNNYSQTSFGNKVASATSSTITLDRPVTLNPATAYKLDLIANDGQTIRSYDISETNGTFTTVTPTTAMVEVPTAGYTAIISSTNHVVAQPFRVISVTEESRGVFTIGAIQYDGDKYSRIESGIVLPTSPYISFTADKVLPVTNITFDVQQFTNPTFGNYTNIVVNWDAPTTDHTVQYIVRVRKDNGNYEAPHHIDQTEFIIERAVPGLWEVAITAINIRGKQSKATTSVYNYSPTGNNTLYPPVNLAIKAGTGISSEFYSQDLSFIWEANPLNDGFPVAGYLIRVTDNGTATQIHEQMVASNVFEFTYTYALNSQNNNGPFRALKVDIFSVDARGLLTVSSLSNVFTNYAPPLPNNFSAAALSNSVMLSWEAVTGPDVKGYIVWASKTPGFAQSSSNYIFKGDATLIPHAGLTSGETWYYRIATFDTFGESLNGTGLNVSSTISAIPTRAGLPSGPAFPTIPAPVAGDFFYRTDTDDLYKFNGTSWVVQADDISANVITGAMVQAYTITGNNVAAGTLTADKMFVSTLSAITANMGAITAGTITLNTSGFIRGGSTAYNTGTGFFLGYDGSAYKFSCGASSGPGVSWDGTTFTIRGAGGSTLLSSGGAISTDFANITGATKPANNATVGATFGTNIYGQINAANASTYIANAAIQQAQIANLAVGTAQMDNLSVTNGKLANLSVDNGKIANLAVDRLKIAGLSVTFPTAANSNSTVGISSIINSNFILPVKVANWNLDSVDRYCKVMFSGFLQNLLQSDGTVKKYYRPKVELLRAGTVIYTLPPGPVVHVDSQTLTFMYVDTLPAGVLAEYTVRVTTTISNAAMTNGAMSHMSMSSMLTFR